MEVARTGSDSLIIDIVFGTYFGEELSDCERKGRDLTEIGFVPCLDDFLIKLRNILDEIK